MRLAPDDSVRVTVRGAGEPIVLIAGPLGGSWGFRRVIPGLVEAGYHVIVIDPFDPEAAGSLAAVTLTTLADRWAAVLDTLRIEHATVVAHSLASSITLRLAANHPRLVRAIVSLEGGMTDHVATPGMRAAVAMAPFARVFGVASLVRRRVASSLRDRSARPAWVTKEVVDTYARPVLRDISRSTALLRRLGNARESESIEDRARTIEVPVLLLLGDAMQPSRPRDDEVARMRAALRSFTVDTIADAGHYLQEEQPAEVVARVVRMAAGVAAGAVGRTGSASIEVARSHTSW